MLSRDGWGLAVHCSEGYRAIAARPSAGGKLVWGCEEGTVMGGELLTVKQRKEVEPLRKNFCVCSAAL